MADTHVEWLEKIDRAYPGSVARRRVCKNPACGHRWLSVELPAFDLNALYLSATGALDELVK